MSIMDYLMVITLYLVDLTGSFDRYLVRFSFNRSGLTRSHQEAGLELNFTKTDNNEAV